MGKPTEFTIGSEVSCSDGVCGDLRRVVIDPVARVLTHLVVEPKHGRAKGHLVPVALVSSTSQGVLLACTRDEFDKLEEAEETQLLPGGDGSGVMAKTRCFRGPITGSAAGRR